MTILRIETGEIAKGRVRLGRLKPIGEALADRRGLIMERIAKTPAASLNGLTEKLAVTVEYHQKIGDDAWAFVAVIEDFRALIG
jgi:hypothetical protein